MKVQPAAFLRTILPTDFSKLEDFDSGRYHSIWLPDHLVSFWPDSIWTPEFTDLATVSFSPHRHLDGLAVAAATAVLTHNTPLATSVVDTVRRHPSSLAQTALTISHLSQGRFILGLGCGETENTVPYGFDFNKPVGRFEESLKVINLLWHSDGPVDFEGEFYQLHHARLDTEPYAGKFPPIWIAASGPRMLRLTGEYADGWWPAGVYSPAEYGEKLQVIHSAAESAGRDPNAITPALIFTCLLGDEAELETIIQAPLVKAFVLQIPASKLSERGFRHPMGDDWRGIQDINPSTLTREKILDMLEKVDPESILALVPNGTPQQVAEILRGYCEAGLRVPKILDYGGMAGLKFSASSAQKVRTTEDELLGITGDLT